MKAFLFFFCIAFGYAYPLLPQEAFKAYHSPQLERGYQSLLAKDFIIARKLFSDLLNTGSRPAALYYLSQTYLQLGQIDQAHELLMTLKSYPNMREAFLHARSCYDMALASYFLKKQDWQQAKLLFEKVLQNTPYRDFQDYIAELYLQRIRILRNPRYLNLRIELLRDSLSFHPEHEESLQMLSDIFVAENSYNEAAPYLEKLTRLFPNRKRRMQLALVFTYVNRIKDSFAILSKLYHEYPDDPDIMEKYIQIKQFLNLKEASNPVTEENSNTPQDLKQELFRVRELLLKQKWNPADSALASLQERYPRNWEPLKERVELKRMLKQYRSALELLENAAVTFQALFEYQYQIALTLEKIDPQECVSFILESLQAEHWRPEELQQWKTLLGKLYLKTEKLDAAHNIFEQLLSQNPENIDEIYFYLGMYYSQIKYFQKSLEYYQAAYQKKPQQPKYLLALSSTLRQLGHKEEALKFVQILLDTAPESKYAEYARKIFQLENPVKTSSSGTSHTPPLYQLFLFYRGSEDLTDSRVIEILELTHQWDRLIEYLESVTSENKSNKSLQQKLETLYKNYPKLDFTTRLTHDTDYQELFRQLKLENKAMDIMEFYGFLPEGTLIPVKVKEEFAKVFLENGESELAEKLYTELLTEGNDKVYYYSQLGYIHFTRSDFDKSLNSYYQALSIEPKNTGILFKLAELLRTTGEIQKSKLVYQEIITLNVSPQSVRDARFFLKQITDTENKRNLQ